MNALIDETIVKSIKKYSDEYLNEDVCQFDNDASASSFGWNFQVNAGIFLFLKYMPEVTDIKIESKAQDIEITLIDEGKVFAQAKSSQDHTAIRDQKEKFKDAIISLSRNPYERNQLVYISNIPNTFKTAPNFFDNSIISYNDCLVGIKEEIDDTICSISKSIDKKIKDEKKSKKVEKLVQLKEKIEKFHKENLYISTIYPYYGNEQNRYIKISDTVLSFLTDTVGLSREDAISIKQQLLQHWQLYFEHNSTIKDNNNCKKITKEDLTWPIVAFLVDGNFPDIDTCLSFQPDLAIKKDVERIMNDPKSFYHARYEFTNRVLQRYALFKKQSLGEMIKQPELEFIRKYGREFIDEFVMFGNEDEQLTEYLTKVFLYRILVNNRYVQKVCKAVGVKA